MSHHIKQIDFLRFGRCGWSWRRLYNHRLSYSRLWLLYNWLLNWFGFFMRGHFLDFLRCFIIVFLSFDSLNWSLNYLLLSQGLLEKIFRFALEH